MSIDFRQSLLAWTPKDIENDSTAGKCRVGYLLELGERDWTDPYACTGLAAHVIVRDMPDERAGAFLLWQLHELILDGVDMDQAHREFMKITQYAEAMAFDPIAEIMKKPR